MLRFFRMLFSAALCFGLANEVRAADTLQPDILLIMPDQMRGDCLSELKHPVVRTPTLDALAQQGTLFRRAYATVPSCIPARYALMTGLAPQTSGVVGFRKKAITVPTLPQLMCSAGYITALVGREMHQQANDQQLGYEICVSGSTYISKDSYAEEITQAFPEIRQFRPWVESLGLTYNHWQAKPWPLSEEWHPTNWVVAKARKLIADAASDQPMFLTASFYAPHPPLFPPRKQFEYYLAQDLPRTAQGDWVNWDSITPQGRDGGHRVLLQGETLRLAQAGYFGLIEHLDGQLAALVTDFRARSERAGRPWLIAVTSDHGEMLGDHGYFRKCEPLEGSANIPMIIAASPDLKLVAGAKCHRPVCLEDLLPTFCEFAGASVPQVDGKSLVGVLRGSDSGLRDCLHFEHAPCYSKEQAFHALTDGRMKYIWRPHGGREHLFDLQQDPREERDLAPVAEQQAELLQWRRRLIARLAPRSEKFSDGTQLIPGRRYAPLNSGLPLTRRDR